MLATSAAEAELRALNTFLLSVGSHQLQRRCYSPFTACRYCTSPESWSACASAGTFCRGKSALHLISMLWYL